jgi:AcrR family transcriptional regulator
MALIAEKGVESLSVAELTRRLGVSSSAPYQHFVNRQDLLVAAAVQAARDLAAEMRGEVQEVQRRSDAEGSAADALAATAVAYATFVAQRRIGFDFIFAPELTRLKGEELAEAGRPSSTALAPHHGDRPRRRRSVAPDGPSHLRGTRPRSAFRSRLRLPPEQRLRGSRPRSGPCDSYPGGGCMHAPRRQQVRSADRRRGLRHD